MTDRGPARKITAGLFMTLDGVVEAPEQWNPPYYDEEMNQAVMPRLARAGAHLYGRRSYELFRGVFTGRNAPPHAAMMTSVPKIVISATLADPGWGPTTVISRDAAAGIARLKAEPGADIAVGASGTLITFLLQHGLLDELTVLVHPVLAGRGRRLFQDGGGQLPLELRQARPHANGVVALRYARAGS